MSTRPGFHITTDFSEYPEGVRSCIRAIGRNFYVTRSFKKEVVGNSEYWGQLARPSSEFSIHLNTDRELLCVFSSYSTFEIRTLEAFDLFYSQLEQKRIDQSIRFLLSGDPRTEAIIHQYLQQNPEYPIIVPVHIPQVRESGGELLEAVRRNYLTRDLFGYQNPLREETFFFGRQEQVNSVLDLAKSGQSSSMFGLRKSGKTFSIYAIMRKAKAFDCTPVLIDCQSPSVHARRYNELLSLVVSEVRKSIGQNRIMPKIEGSEVEVAEKFREQIKTAISQSKNNILIIFDEIENISPRTASSPHWENERDCLLFWQNLRSFIQKDSNGKMAICIVGTSPSLLEEQKIANAPNPIYLFAPKRYISALSYDETKELIDRLGFFMGLDFDATHIARLQNLYGGHPFFTRQVCSILHRNMGHNRPIKVSNRKIDEAIEQFGGQLVTYLDDILSSLEKFYPAEFEMLRSVATGDTQEVSEYGRDAPDLIYHLIGYDLVERRGDDFDIRYESVKTALLRKFQPRGTEYYWTQSMLRRNRLEVGIRNQLFHFSKGLTSDQWRDLIKAALTKSRYDALQSIEPRVLFSQKTSPLYWTDLMGLLKSDVTFPYLDDRRDRLVSAMSKVNFDGRGDSHAKKMNQGEFENLGDAFLLLEDEFGDPE
jgi:AAA+ ATPase superfamily predicted ATPase